MEGAYEIDFTPSRQAILGAYGGTSPSGIDLASSNRKIQETNDEIERKFAECEKGNSPEGKNLLVTCVIRQPKKEAKKVMNKQRKVSPKSARSGPGLNIANCHERPSMANTGAVEPSENLLVNQSMFSNGSY